MLYFIKYRLMQDKVKELADAMKAGEIEKKAKFLYASKEDTFIGLSFWEVGEKKDVDMIIDQLKQYTQIIENYEVVSANEVQEKLMERLGVEGKED
ncbi:MAG: hypothetical protein GY863_04575 [bacterium]|nr:hypothetical protein [bacterium]